MLKREITYEDFNGDNVTEPFYFNLTKSELMELESSYQGGLEAAIKAMINAEDNHGVLKEFQKIILMSYGQKSPDGKRFIKSDELRDEFLQSAAYDALFMELATTEDAMIAFINGVLPKDMVAEVAKMQEVNLPPRPPEVGQGA